MPKQLFLCLFFLFFCLRGFCAVFVVTSNADSGPGTLRDALTQAAANGSTEKDYINFNLPDLSEAGRTITLLSLLPNVSSNLIIDGSTQPGNKFGISDAKITLTQNTVGQYPAESYAFKGEDVNNIEIDGFYFSLFESSNYDGAGIYITHSSNVIIGAVDKGNVFSLIEEPVYLYYCNNCKVSANLFGIDPFTSEVEATAWTCNLQVYCSNGIIIGGNTAKEGNMFIYGRNSTQFAVSGLDPQTGMASFDSDSCIFKNNIIGYNADNGSYCYGGLSNIKHLEITSNILNYNSSLVISNISEEVLIRGNRCNIDPPNPGKSFSIISPYALNSVKKAIIGGPDPSDANSIINSIFYGQNSQAISAYKCYDILIQRNSIACKAGAYGVYSVTESMVELPVISINAVNGNIISGKATPMSEVEVFSDSECQLCEPTHYLGSVTANSDSTWKFTATGLSSGYSASASINGRTSLFTKVGYNADNAIIKNPSCGNSNGSIKGITVVNSTKTEWTDQTGKIVGTSPDINNLPPGTYTFTAYLGSFCNVKSNSYTLIDATPHINDANLKISQNQCGKDDGSIDGLYIDNTSNYTIKSATWTDGNLNNVGSGYNLDNVAAGNYTFTVVTTDNCVVTYGPVSIKNSTGPNIDQANQIIQPTNCGQSTGSITNIAVTGTGTLKYVWLNAQQQQVGSSADLINQPAGTYKLQVTDDTQCGPVYSADIIIPEVNGITMDESKVQITNALCGGTGSITGIQVTGASGYKWTDANNHTLITTTPDVGALAPGSYTLTATNSYGCSKSSAVYIITQPISFPYPVYTATYTQACNLLANGGVSVATDGSVKSARWVDAQGTTVETGSSLSNVVAGTYQLYLTDNNGCEKLYNSYTIDQYPEFTVANYATITADECGLNNGSVGPTTITGGIPPYTYAWSDASNKSLGTSNQLTNVAAGTYILHVNDNGCGSVDITYTVTEQTYIPPAPSVTNVQLCSSGNGLLTVNNPSANTTYRLYASQSATQPLDEQKGGRFNINVPGNVSYYVSEVDGTCESSRAEIDVTVGVSSTDIANAFTPNGDGINDYWQIKNIDNYTNATIQVFNRYGQLLFESKGYAKPFDGTYKGQKLAAGVYYYIINLNAKCNLLSGSLTLIR
ncbi:gliding motility-associated C-terminal domain-containing protein [Mucilaginibacter mallensis]|uniref:Gliding motility-associated C-terminal domain-containing protein n=1 Tax=Mucilaginibacter mallensis TaxID=652787 RepID=A0A1H2C7D5_MUCMA|nr:gliding motility-associated C-terminal domain-containing protein [Mucilaginibacter mallensis]SDT66445.1 gliding motility-associated C-terminal domain-containing protein [Mucilaginibacter mallensis]